MTQLSTLIQGSGKNAIDKRSYIATSGQTVFAVTYSPPYVDVYQNGVRLNVVDYTATSGTSITLGVGAAVNDEIELIGFASDASITASFSGPNAPVVPIEGMMWYDTTDGSLYVRTGNFWVEASQAGATQGIQGIQGPPGDGVVISGITVTDASYANTDDTAVGLTGGYIKVTGTGFVSGCTVVVGTVIATSVTFISSTEVRAQLPALTAGTYVLYVSNPSGAVAIRVNAITFSALPTWVSTSPLPNGKLNEAISIQLSGTSDSSVTYTLQSGSTLPAGVTISSSGLLSGTVTGITTETTYNFTVVATDAELQDSPKAFSITITVLYAVARSLRLRSAASAYLNRTFAAGNRTTWTWSGWIKRGKLGAGGVLFQGYSSIGDRSAFQFNSSDQLFFNGIVGILTTAVFRDPAAWYHMVCVYDSTNATDSNRVILYVNGVRQTVTGTYPTVSQAEFINGAWLHYLSTGYSGAFEYTDGEMAEVNFVDGQALTAASFGQVSVTSGAWIPKAYAGTYGTNGFYLPFNGSSTSSYATSFSSSAQYAQMADNVAFSFGTNPFTIEMWVCPTASLSNSPYIFTKMNTAANTNPGLGWYVELATNSIIFAPSTGSGGYAQYTSTIALNVWTHLAFTRVGSSLTCYVNGVSIGTQTVALAASSNDNNYPVQLGNWTAYTSTYFTGYMSNVRVVKGTAVYTSNFTPSTIPLTAISGTSLLTLQNSTLVDNSGNSIAITNGGSVVNSVQYPFSTTIFKDVSGNANNWTPNNISLTAGSAYDSMLDSPVPSSTTVGNYAVLNPLQIGGTTMTPTPIALSNGNLSWSYNRTSTGAGWIQGTIAIPATGKWYYEYVSQSGAPVAYSEPGIMDVATIKTQAVPSVFRSYYGYDGTKISNGTSTAYGAAAALNDIITVAIDMDNGAMYFGKNGTWLNSGVPTSGASKTGAAFTDLISAGVTWAPMMGVMGDNYATGSVNFGQQPWQASIPAGYLALNTFNLPASAVPNPATAMAATTYTGTGVARSISNAVNTVSFQPDLVWIKNRSGVNSHQLVDSIRGVTKYLFSDGTAADDTRTDQVTAFSASGFSLSALIVNTAVNNTANNYVAWQWKAGGAVTANNNTAGTITSTVSANQTARFSIVTYTGTGVNATVGHGLGVTPGMVIIKSRNSAVNWIVYHSGLTSATYFVSLNQNIAQTSYPTVFNSTAPTNAVFNIGTDASINQSAGTYVAYCWAPVAGYSSFGKYTGNGSADGPFIYTGFRPRFVMIKNITNATYGDWQIYDASRSTYNLTALQLQPNASGTEYDGSGSGIGFDLVSNGVKVRTSNASRNNSGDTYIYAAFAESEFNFATAR